MILEIFSKKRHANPGVLFLLFRATTLLKWWTWRDRTRCWIRACETLPRLWSMTPTLPSSSIDRILSRMLNSVCNDDFLSFSSLFGDEFDTPDELPKLRARLDRSVSPSRSRSGAGRSHSPALSDSTLNAVQVVLSKRQMQLQVNSLNKLIVFSLVESLNL